MEKRDRILELAQTTMLRKDIAKEVGCTASYVSDVLNGKTNKGSKHKETVEVPAATVRLNLQTGVAQIDCEDESAGIDAHIIARLGPEFKALLESVAKLC